MNCVLFTKMDQVFSKENKTLKKYWKIGKKILEKSGKSQGILSVRKSGNPDYIIQKSYTGTGSDADENQLNSTISVDLPM